MPPGNGAALDLGEAATDAAGRFSHALPKPLENVVARVENVDGKAVDNPPDPIRLGSLSDDVADCDFVLKPEPNEPHSRVGRPSGWGALTGRFVFDGPVPEPEPIRLRMEAAPDGSGRVIVPAERLYHDKELFDESLLVAEDGGLANVFVYLRSPQAVPVHPDLEKPPAEQVVLRVRDGRFDPHALAMRADQTARADRVPHDGEFRSARNEFRAR